VLKFLKFLNRLRLGHSPIFVEYEYDFKPRWQDGGNPFIREVIARQQATIDQNIRSLNQFVPLVRAQFVPLVRALSENKNAAVPRVDWRNTSFQRSMRYLSCGQLLERSRPSLK